MNENINLCEILKDCPKGTKLYSPLFGEVEFRKINKTEYPITVLAFFPVMDNPDELCVRKYFSSDGKYYKSYEGAECMLFPSKDQRDWSKWKCPNPKKPKFDPKTLKPFDKVLTRDKYDQTWRCSFFSHYNKYLEEPFVCAIFSCKHCIPYNDNTEHLVGTKEEAPEYYRYWEE